MPSTHSTALGFYLVYLWPLLPLTLTSAGAWVERAALVAVTGLGLWSRVKLGYHTVPQVVVGAGVGFASALAWAAVWSSCPEIGPALQDVIDRVRGMIL
jgi:dolichyldiphosphatase